VSAATDLPFVGEKAESKLAKAESLGVRVMSEADFIAAAGARGSGLLLGWPTWQIVAPWNKSRSISLCWSE